MSESAVAIAPNIIPREVVSYHAREVLGCADLYSRKHRQRVVFFSDLTLMFADAGTSWSQLGVDWQSALQELRGGQFPGVIPDHPRARLSGHRQPPPPHLRWPRMQGTSKTNVS